jgi:hypothetical protein
MHRDEQLQLCHHPRSGILSSPAPTDSPVCTEAGGNRADHKRTIFLQVYRIQPLDRPPSLLQRKGVVKGRIPDVSAMQPTTNRVVRASRDASPGGAGHSSPRVPQPPQAGRRPRRVTQPPGRRPRRVTRPASRRPRRVTRPASRRPSRVPRPPPKAAPRNTKRPCGCLYSYVSVCYLKKSQLCNDCRFFLLAL